MQRIVAHFMICYTALLIYRLLEAKLSQYGTHFTIENIIEALNNMEVANIKDMCYMSTYNNSQICTASNALFNLGLDKKYYQPKELNKKTKNIQVSSPYSIHNRKKNSAAQAKPKGYAILHFFKY